MAKKFYAVKIGKTPGVYETWAECQNQINGFSGAVYKGFATKEEAIAFVGQGGGHRACRRVLSRMPPAPGGNDLLDHAALAQNQGGTLLRRQEPPGEPEGISRRPPHRGCRRGQH